MADTRLRTHPDVVQSWRLENQLDEANALLEEAFARIRSLERENQEVRKQNEGLRLRLEHVRAALTGLP